MRVPAIFGVLAAIAACSGGGGGGDDAPSDPDAAAPPVDAGEQQCFGELGAWEPVPGLSTEASETGARLSADELTAYFALATGEDDADIVVARRDAVDEPFGTPTTITAVSSGDSELWPSVSADGRTLVFTRMDADDRETLWMSTRASIDDDFGAPTHLDAFDATINPRQGLLTRDGAELWFASLSGIYRATRVDGTYRDAVEVIPMTDTLLHAPTVSDDGRTLYYVTYSNDTGYRVMRAERSTPDAPWGDATEVEIPLGGHESYHQVPTWLSPDGCRLYLYGLSTSSPSIDMYMATRAP